MKIINDTFSKTRYSSMSEDIFGPPMWGLDPVLKTSTRKFRTQQHSEIAHQKAENDLMKRDIAEKDAQIRALSEKVAEFTQSLSDMHALIRDFEAVADQKFFTPEQATKLAFITHMEYTRILTSCINTIIKQHNALQDQFTADFARYAENVSDKLIAIRDEFLAVRKRKEEVLQNTQHLRRLYQINERERQSLQIMVEQLNAQKSQIDSYAQLDNENFKLEYKKVHQETREFKLEAEQVNKKFEKKLSKPPARFTSDTRVEDSILQREITTLAKRYDMESQNYENTYKEYEHVMEEINRGKEHIKKHMKALDRQELENAQRVNKELRAYIESERANDKMRYESQVKRNKELERTIQEHLDEQNMLKQYLMQIDKKMSSQSTKLPILGGAPKESGSDSKNTTLVLSRHKADDAEMKAIKKAMSSIARKKVINQVGDAPQKL